MYTIQQLKFKSIKNVICALTFTNLSNNLIKLSLFSEYLKKEKKDQLSTLIIDSLPWPTPTHLTEKNNNIYMYILIYNCININY